MNDQQLDLIGIIYTEERAFLSPLLSSLSWTDNSRLTNRCCPSDRQFSLPVSQLLTCAGGRREEASPLLMTKFSTGASTGTNERFFETEFVQGTEVSLFHSAGFA